MAETFQRSNDIGFFLFERTGTLYSINAMQTLPWLQVNWKREMALNYTPALQQAAEKILT